MKPADYSCRLRQYHQTCSATMDVKALVIRLHERVRLCARKASLEPDSLQRALWENRGLHILNGLTIRIVHAKTANGADPEVCDRLLMVYHACSLYLCRGEHQQAVELMQALQSEGTPSGRKGNG